MPDDHPGWDIEAFYIAQLLHAITCIASPHRIVLGGGAGGHPAILARVSRGLRTSLGNYFANEPLVSRLDEYVLAPALGMRSGLLGALRLAQLAEASAA